MDEHYRQAIDLLMNKDLDYRRICVELAKMEPKVFVRLALVQQEEPWIRNVIKLLREGQKVDAIRSLRIVTGFGLKEAKDICDHLMHYFADHNICARPEFPAYALTDPRAIEVLNQIKARVF